MDNIEKKIRDEGNKLIKKHIIIGNKLREIPKNRNMRYTISTENTITIGKPRFEKTPYSWNKPQLNELLDHLQDIWNYLQKHHYYFDHKILSFINKDSRRSSKESIIFLLERDVWETDEVYGDYLIEKTNNSVEISYIRRNEKRKTFKLKMMDDEQIKEWIINNAREQIISSFDYKWNLLLTEIDTCANGLHIKLPPVPLSTKELHDQILLVEKILEIDVIVATLALGRVSELWCIILLKQTERNMFVNYIQELKQKGLINNHKQRLLNNIRIIYNSVKHKTNFRVDENTIRELYTNFCNLAGVKKASNTSN